MPVVFEDLPDVIALARHVVERDERADPDKQQLAEGLLLLFSVSREIPTPFLVQLAEERGLVCAPKDDDGS